jgi:TonB family protein
MNIPALRSYIRALSGLSCALMCIIAAGCGKDTREDAAHYVVCAGDTLGTARLHAFVPDTSARDSVRLVGAARQLALAGTCPAEYVPDRDSLVRACAERLRLETVLPWRDSSVYVLLQAARRVHRLVQTDSGMTVTRLCARLDSLAARLHLSSAYPPVSVAEASWCTDTAVSDSPGTTDTLTGTGMQSLYTRLFHIDARASRIIYDFSKPAAASPDTAGAATPSHALPSHALPSHALPSHVFEDVRGLLSEDTPANAQSLPHTTAPRTEGSAAGEHRSGEPRASTHQGVDAAMRSTRSATASTAHQRTSAAKRKRPPRREAAWRYRSQQSVRDTVGAHQLQIQLLYKKALRRRPGLEGTVWIEFHIDPDGSVHDARVQKTTLQDSVFLTALKDYVTAIRFQPVPSHARRATFVFPFRFSPDM